MAEPRYFSRPDPDELVRQMQARERDTGRGRLKIFLGYSSGVGKSLRMFDEGRRRKLRGEDVVVAAVQPHTEGAALEVLQGLETVPMAVIDGEPVLDLEGVLRRHPEVCLVDGLAYDNPPGCFWPHRWQQLVVLLQAGIGVIASVNLQFIEERRAAVERITGRQSTQTVPLSFLRQAEELELVDAPPDLLPAAGNAAAAPLRRRQQLSELREQALLLAAEVVDHQLESYLTAHGITPVGAVQERILVCMIAAIPAGAMLASGRRNADRFRGELLAAFVRRPGTPEATSPAMAENLRLAEALGAQVSLLEGDDFVETILPFAASRGVTQIYVGHSLHKTWWKQLAGSKLERLIAGAHNMDVRVFPH